VARAQGWDRAARFFSDPRVTQTGGVLDPGVVWSTRAARYDDGSLLAWMERLEGVPELKRARVVISDNLAGVLAFRRDAVLAGSFLWGDVLAQAHAENGHVRAFAALENELLERYRPPMLCVRDVVMPAVTERTQAIAVDWMCEEVDGPNASAPPAVPRVAVLGDAAGSLLVEAAHELTRSGKYELALPASRIGATARAVEFGHQAADYRALSAAVCRPGVGTITDCIAHGIPMVTLHEGPTHPELGYIGARLNALGVATDLGADPDQCAIVAAVDEVLQEPVRTRMRARVWALQRNGLRQAVDFLGRRLEGVG
jgi:hypothetical protein